MPSKIKFEVPRSASIKISRLSRSPKLLAFRPDVDKADISPVPVLPSPTRTISQPSSPTKSMSTPAFMPMPHPSLPPSPTKIPLPPSLPSSPTTSTSTPSTRTSTSKEVVPILPLELQYQVADIILSQAIHSLLHTPSPKFMRPGYEHRVRAIFGRPALNIHPLMLTSRHLYGHITTHPLFAQLLLYFLLNNFSPFSRDFNSFTIPVLSGVPRSYITVRAIRGRAFPEIESLSNVLSCRYDAKPPYEAVPEAMQLAQRADPDLFVFSNLIRLIQTYGAHHGNDVIFEHAANHDDVLYRLETVHGFRPSEIVKSVDGPLCLVWRPDVPLVSDEWKIQSQFGYR